VFAEKRELQVRLVPLTIGIFFLSSVVVHVLMTPCFAFQAIIPYVPIDKPRLDHLVYEMMLGRLLMYDRGVSIYSTLASSPARS
jgi:hypothetical protein